MWFLYVVFVCGPKSTKLVVVQRSIVILPAPHDPATPFVLDLPIRSQE